MRKHKFAQLVEESLITPKMAWIRELRMRDGPSFIDHGSLVADDVLSEQFDLGFAIAVNPLEPAVFSGSIDHAEHFDI